MELDGRSKRTHVPHISRVREEYENSRDILLGLLDADTENIDATLLVAAAQNIKSSFRVCRDWSRTLASRLSAVGASSETKDLKEARLSLGEECAGIINQINGRLRNLDQEEISNVDVRSTYSGVEEPQAGRDVAGLHTSETPFMGGIFQHVGREKEVLPPSSNLPLTPKEKVDNFLKAFGGGTSCADSCGGEGAKPETSLLASAAGDGGSRVARHGISFPASHSATVSSPFHLHPPLKATTIFQPRCIPSITDHTQFCKPSTYAQCYIPPKTTNTQYHNPPLTTSQQTPFPSSIYHTLHQPNYTNKSHNALFKPTYNHQTMDPASQHLIKQELFRGSFGKFSGEPHKYNSWFRVLKNRMKNLSLDAMDVITILSASTTGEPHKMIQNLLAAVGDDPQVTLDLMLSSLHNRFGSDIKISSSLKKQLADFPRVRPPNVKDKLRDLTDLCRVVLVNQRNNRELMVFNSSDDQRMIWSKLPEWMQARWRSRGHEYMVQNCESPPFSMLVDFLERHSDEMSNPHFWDLEGSSLAKECPVVLRVENQSSHPSNKCLLHNTSSHDISECMSFSKLQYFEKIKFARAHRLCFNCLSGHMASACDYKEKCEKCDKPHLTVMHNPRTRFGSLRHESAERDNVQLCSILCGNPSSIKNCSKTLLSEVYHPCEPRKRLLCYSIIDEQSNSSFIDPKLVELLGVKGPEHEYTLTTMTGYRTKHSGMIVEGLMIKGVNCDQSYHLPALYTNHSIPNCKDEIASPDIVRAHKHISHLAKYFPDVNPTVDVMLLIGRDSGELMKTKCHGSTFPYAHHTPLGWALVGASCAVGGPSDETMLPRAHSEHLIANKCFSSTTPSGSLAPLTQCFEERRDDETTGLSQEDVQFLEIMNDGVYVNRRGYLTMPLPFRNKNVTLPNNKTAVYCRTRGSLERLKRDKPTLDACIEIMETSLRAGHVEPVPFVDLTAFNIGRVWWLPIFVVLHPRKKKPRLVFDSSATYGGVSLNNQLLQGPDDNNRLLGVLIRFRSGEVGFSCDIEAMYYNFHLREEDRNFVRFFWFKDNDPTQKIVEYRGMVHLFGNRPSPAVAHFGLKYTVSHSEEADLAVSKSFLEDNFYVDDGLGCSRTAEDAIRTIEGARAILQRYNIRLHKIASNTPEVVNHFPASERSTSSSVGEGSVTQTRSVLGLAWDIEKDELYLQVDLPDRPFTRRGMLSIVGSLYDPLGMISPITLQGKCLQREIMLKSKSNESKCDWDAPLPVDYGDRWNSWMSSLSSFDRIRLPRSYIPANFGEIKSVELHVFCDASELAIAAVAYLRVTSDAHGGVSTSYVMSKSKLVPRAALSMPRAELCAALEASLLSSEVVRELNLGVSSVTLYTDSMVVLGYLRNTEKKFSNYVARRVHTILQCTKVSQWSYVSTSLNPADIGTRCHSIESLLGTCWIRGPHFLHCGSVVNHDYDDTNLQLPELQNLASTLEVSSVPSSRLEVIFERISSLNRAIKVVQFLLSATYRLVDGVRARLGHCTVRRNTEINRDRAIEALVSCGQISCYSDLKEILRRNGSASCHRLSSLNPYIDSFDIVRVGGRLKNSAMHPSQKHPILLPPKHPITLLIVRYYHERVVHQGRYLTHGAIREAGFHIEKGTKFIKTFIHSCVTCRRLRSPTSVQIMADLPACRLEETPPFYHTGVDVFGPFIVADGKTTRQTRGSKKVWGLMLTCMVSRAIHVEPLHGLDTSSLRNCIRRFNAVRGTCKNFYSDCGTNFVGSDGQDREISLLDVQKDLENSECQWHFNTPHSSHHGGAWERKIGAFRRVFEASMLPLRNRLLSRDEFGTLLYEAMAVVNNTPLWEVSSDPNDPGPMTPARLLTLKDTPTSLPLDAFSERDILSYGKRRWKRVQYLADCFWEQWRKHYIFSLLERSKWQETKRNLAEGDVVLMRDKTIKRNYWPTGVITSVKKSNDGFVRSVSVDVLIQGRNGPTRRTYDRPIADVVLLIPKE